MTDKEMRTLGRNFTAGALAYIGGIFLIYLTLMAVIGGLFFGVFDYDDTDGHSTRSGMVLRTDYGTGCQYLETGDGGITPRLNADGSQSCGSNQ